MSCKPKVLLVGEYMWPWYQECCAIALESIGCEVIRFGWHNDFRRWVPGAIEPEYHSLWHRIQYRLQSGPNVWRVNRRLLKTAEEERPNIVWFYNVQLIAPRVVKKLKSLLPDAIFCQYANDNPFSKNAKPHLWKNFRESIPFFDAHFVFRDSDSHGYLAHGVNEVKLLRSYFIPEMDYPVLLPEIPQQYICDVVFAGHYENDGRVEMLEAICDAGFNLNLFGGGWNLALKGLRLDSPLRSKYPITPVIEENYRYAICGAKVALCFLSTLNQDTYTTRNFQIPAMKTAMLSQYTDDLASLFKPGEEALYFESAKELLAKLRVLVEDEGLRSRLATAGYMRVHSDGHDVSSRMQIWLRDVLGKGENE